LKNWGIQVPHDCTRESRKNCISHGLFWNGKEEVEKVQGKLKAGEVRKKWQVNIEKTEQYEMKNGKGKQQSLIILIRLHTVQA
jgi:hypothetical protein